MGLVCEEGIGEMRGGGGRCVNVKKHRSHGFRVVENAKRVEYNWRACV